MIKCQEHLSYVDGVMLGRKVYADPTFLLDVDQQIYKENTANCFDKGMKAYMEYILALENPKDVNRAITHLVQVIKKISFSKEIRKQLLLNVRNNKRDLKNIFYAGNVGKPQNLQDFINFFQQNFPNYWSIDLYGAGQELENVKKLKNINRRSFFIRVF